MATCEAKAFVHVEMKEVRTAKQRFTLVLSQEEAEAAYAVASNVVGKSPQRDALDRVADALYREGVRANGYPNVTVQFNG